MELQMVCSAVIVAGMTLTIDKAGRLVLPKPVRDRLGLCPGAELDLHVEADGELRLRARHLEPALALINGVLIHQGRVPSDFDWNAILERERSERSRTVTGSLLS